VCAFSLLGGGEKGRGRWQKREGGRGEEEIMRNRPKKGKISSQLVRGATGKGKRKPREPQGRPSSQSKEGWKLKLHGGYIKGRSL